MEMDEPVASTSNAKQACLVSERHRIPPESMNTLEAQGHEKAPSTQNQVLQGNKSSGNQTKNQTPKKSEKRAKLKK